MIKYNTPEISNGVYAVGAKDRNRRLFDALVPLPRGTTFNSYLVKGAEKTALIDSVGPGFEQELLDKISSLTDLSKLDYVVMNHAEPDHSTALGAVVRESRATLYTTEKGAPMAARYSGVPAERIKTIKDGDTIELGGKKLRFIESPWLHWPETMFTYLEENKVLFSCDFFGAHAPDGTYDDDIPDIISLAKGYFAEIMMPLRPFCKKGLDKVAALEITTIAPSHGPVYRNPSRIIDAYRSWVAGETLRKAVIVYVTTWGATEQMANCIAEALAKEGINPKLYNLASFDMGQLAEDLVDSPALVVGSPTLFSGLHPYMNNTLNLIKLLKPPVKFGAAICSYGWGKGALKQAQEFFENAKIEFVGAVDSYGPPHDEEIQKITELAGQLAAKISAHVVN
jgi:flavorubredoxin